MPSEDYDGDPACECEHISHFHDVSPRSTAHVYFTRFKPEELVVADTIWGKFPVCKTCKDTCLKNHLRDAEETLVGIVCAHCGTTNKIESPDDLSHCYSCGVGFEDKPCK